MKKQPIFAVSDLRVTQYAIPASIVTVAWTESIEDGDRPMMRAVSTPEQFDAVMAEYVAALNEAYRPK